MQYCREKKSSIGRINIDGHAKTFNLVSHTAIPLLHSTITFASISFQSSTIAIFQMVTMQSPKPLLLYQCLLHVNPVGRLWSACHIHHYPIFRKMDLQICNVSFSFCRSRIKKQLAKNQRTWSLMDLHMKTVQCRSKKVDYIHWY